MAISEVYQIPIVAGLIEEQLDPEHELLVLARKLDWRLLRSPDQSTRHIAARLMKTAACLSIVTENHGRYLH